MLVETMHRRVTPFAVLYKESRQIQKEEVNQRKFNAASFHTIDDVGQLDLPCSRTIMMELRKH